MGICSSCARRDGQERMCCMEALTGAAIARLLPLATLGEQGISQEERLRRLQDVRQRCEVLSTRAALETEIAGIWTQEELELPRRCGEGGPVRVLLHQPCGEHAWRDLPLVVWMHSGGLSYNTFYEPALAKALKAAAQPRERGAPTSQSIEAQALEADAARPAGLCCWASVDYRLAPEAPFPACVDDAVSAYLALAEPSNAERFGYGRASIGLAGVSAGAFVAAHAALRLAEPGCGAQAAHAPRPSFLGLDYPMVDPRMRTQSWDLHGDDAAACPRPWLRQCWQWALAGPDDAATIGEERAREASLLSGRWNVPALQDVQVRIVLGQRDPLFDEGSALAECIRAAGHRVEVVEALGPHATAHLFDAPASQRLAASWLQLLAA